MRDWDRFVRERLRVPGLKPERESRIVRELAIQLEDFYREALAGGATEADADAHAIGQVRDWERMTEDVWLADRPNARPSLERLADTLDGVSGNRGMGGTVMADVLRDVRYAVRQLAKTPGFSIVAILTLQYPDASADESAQVVLLKEQVVGDIRPALLTLLAAVTVVILIACANVANLLLVRASVREKEIAIRGALGAGRRRLVLQLLSESLVLAVAGGGLGLLLAYFSVRPVQTLSAGSIPRVADIAIDGSVLAFSIGLTLVTGIIFGLAPAWQASRPGLGEVLKEGGRSSTVSSGRWLRNGLMIAEVALSIVLLVGATLLLRSFSRITGVDPGFRPDNVLAFRVTLPAKSYPGKSACGWRSARSGATCCA